MSEEKRRPDAGETVRDGVRSIVGILGALKDAIEQSFDDLRESGDRPADRESGARESEASEAEPDKSPAQHAKEAVESVRDRFDFVTRKELEALRDQVERLSERIAALEGNGTEGADDPAEPPPEDEPWATEAPKASEPEPPEERPFRIDSE